MESVPEGGNTLLEVYLRTNSREALDLTGGSAEMTWKIGARAETASPMTVVSGTSGQVTYRFGNGELVPGVFSGHVVATDADGYKYPIRQPIYFRVWRTT